nr:spermine oxidase-like [Penaeus vannamei]
MILTISLYFNITFAIEIKDPEHYCKSEGELEEGQVLIVNKDGSSLLADHVIFTASSGHLQERHRQLFSPPLPGDYVSALEGIELGVANKVQMGWDDPWWGEDPLELDIVWTEFDLPEEKVGLRSTSRPPPRTLVPEIPEDVLLVAVLMWSCVLRSVMLCVHLSPHAVIEGFVTGEASEIMESLSEEQVREHFLELLRNASLMSIPEPMFFRSCSSGSKNSVGGGKILFLGKKMFLQGVKILQEVLQWAGEHTSPHRFSTVDGAMGTGEREAKRLLNALRLEGVYEYEK